MEIKNIENNLKERVLNIKSAPYFDNSKVETLLNSKLNTEKSEIKENELYLFLLGMARRVKNKGGGNSQLYKNVFQPAPLKEFALNLYKKSKINKIMGYQIKIPAPITRFTPIENPAHPGHAVALILNPFEKKIIYHDSCGIGMAKELQDILNIVLIGWEIVVNKHKSQFNEKEDASCSILSLLNAYYAIKHELNEKIDNDLDFSNYSSPDFKTDMQSEKFREYLWTHLKKELIQEELLEMQKSKQITDVPKKVLFRIIKTTLLPEIDKDYELYLDPEYDDFLAEIRTEIQKIEVENNMLTIKKNNIRND